MTESIEHPFPPVYDSSSRILILGSFPSVRSRKEGFYYMHPRNRFWPLMEKLFDRTLPDIQSRITFLHDEHIALWDSVNRCRIEGSADSTIEDAEPNDIAHLIAASAVKAVFTNGTAAHDLYMKYIYPETGIAASKLPSTSPANASWSLERLVKAWSVILDDTER